MKRRSVLACATALVSLTSIAHATPAWYVGLEAGANWLSTIHQAQVPPAAPPINQFIDFDTGYAVFGTVGRRLDANWRIEAEIGYRENKLDRFTGTLGSNFQPDGINAEFTLMANVVYDIAMGDGVSLSLGAGIGADHDRTTSKTQGFDDAQWAFAYQAIVGVNYAIGPKTELFVNVRYLGVDDLTYHDASLPAAGALAQDGIEKQTLTLGVRFAFDPGG